MDRILEELVDMRGAEKVEMSPIYLMIEAAE